MGPLLDHDSAAGRVLGRAVLGRPMTQSKPRDRRTAASVRAQFEARFPDAHYIGDALMKRNTMLSPQRMHYYVLHGIAVILWIWSEGRAESVGFDILAPASLSNDIEETFAAVDRMIGANHE
jgi:hypothetical protein